MNLIQKILAGSTLATLTLLQGCLSYPNSRMYQICSPLTNVPLLETDIQAREAAQRTINYFREDLRDSLEEVEYRTATRKEMGSAIGRYVFLKGGIVFLVIGLNEKETDDVLFHELLHRLDWTSKIDRFRFFQIYNNIDSRRYPVKRVIENFLQTEEYNSALWKDPNSERIAYLYDYWQTGTYDIPHESIEFSRTFLDEEFIEQVQQSLYTAKD